MERGMAAEPLFKRNYRLPIFLAVTIGMFNQLSGINAILYYSNYIFAAAGFSQISGALQTVSYRCNEPVWRPCLACLLIDKLGRKNLAPYRQRGIACASPGVAAVFFTHSHLNALVWLLVAYIFFFAISQGAVIWVYIAEVFPNRVRDKGQSLGSSSHWIMNAVISLIFPILGKVLWRHSLRLLCGHDGTAIFCSPVYLPRRKAFRSNSCSGKLGII